MQRRSREEMRAGFRERMKEDQQRKDGGFYSSLFRKDVKIPFMKNGEGFHQIDILSYVAGKNDLKPNKAGAWVFEFDAYSKDIGTTGTPLVARIGLGLNDPIAEDRAKKQREARISSITCLPFGGQKKRR